MRTLTLAAVIVVASCGPRTRFANGDGGVTADAMRIISCAPDAGDQQGCGCTGAGSRACYSGEPSTRGVGVCHDGMQACSGGEVGTYGTCDGEVLPGGENCKNGLDDDCNGLVDCADPTCATDPA